MKDSEESGLTLVELLVSIVILTMITGGLAAAFATAVNGARPTNQRVRESNDAQLIAAYLVRDAQSAGGTDPATGALDPALGVGNGPAQNDGNCSLVRPSDVAAADVVSTSLAMRFTWNDRLVGSVTTNRAYYYYMQLQPPLQSRLVRQTCGTTSPEALTLGRHLANAPVTSCAPAVCPGLPDSVTMTVAETNNPANSDTPYTYTLTASLRAQQQGEITQVNSTRLPLLVLGGGASPCIETQGSASIKIWGAAYVNGGCTLESGAAYTATGGTTVTPPATCAGVPAPCTVGSVAIANPYQSLAPPNYNCTNGTSSTPGATVYTAVNPTLTGAISAGIKIFCNGVTLTDADALSGVLIYVVKGQFQVGNNSDFKAAPLASGPYGVTAANIVLWYAGTYGPSPNNNNKVTMCCSNNGTIDVRGTVYSPNAPVELKGDSLVYSVVAQSVSIGAGNQPANLGVIPSPLLSLTTTTLPAWTVNRPYSSPVPVAAGGSGGNTWSATGLPAGLSINPLNGVISGTPTTAGGYTVALTVIDSIGEFATRSITLLINNTPTISLPADLVDWTVGRTYPNTAITANLGTTPYAWTATGFPSGVSINATTGVISGAPTVTGNFTPTVTMTDAAGAIATHPYAFTINAAPTITGPATLPNWTANQNGYSQTMTRANGTAPFVWSASGLPNGLTINSATGVISTKPTTAGTFNVTVSLTDDAGAVATRNYTVTINPAPGIATGALNAGEQNRPYSFTVTPQAGAGTPPFTWTASNLHTGLTIGLNTGTISGTPTIAGTRNVTVTISDDTGASTNKVFSLVVNTPVAITGPATIQDYTVGRNYPNTQVTASSGVTPYTWSATGLPSGMSINSLGVITGTPTVSGTFNPVIKVTSSLGGTDTQNYTFTINPAPTVDQTSLPVGERTRAYSTTVSASNGTGAKTWTASGLPPGLTINAASGAITGTPTTIGSFDVTLTATDTVGGSGSKILTIVINQLPSITSTAGVLMDWTVGVVYPNTTISATSGTPPYTWSATNLPTGLTIDANTGIVSGTPTTAQTRTNVTFTVTDSLGGTGTFVDPSVQIFGAPSITNPASLPNGTVNQVYTNTAVTGSGGRTPYGWSATGLPAGMTINSTTGIIGGTPTAAGAFNVVVTLTDQSGATATHPAYSLSIAGATPSITTASLPNGEFAVGYNATNMVLGGTAPYTWSATGLPVGVSINASTGALTGTPNTTGFGTFSVIVTVTDNLGQPDTKAMSLIINPHITTTSCNTRRNQAVGGSLALAATGASGALTWSGTTSAGTIVVNSGGTFGGSAPGSGTYPFALTVTDATGHSTTSNFTIGVVNNNPAAPLC